MILSIGHQVIYICVACDICDSTASRSTFFGVVFHNFYFQDAYVKNIIGHSRLHLEKLSLDDQKCMHKE